VLKNCMLTPEEVTKVLKTVIDPELGYNIVDLGLIYNVEIIPKTQDNPPHIVITMTLTTPGCPLAPYFSQTIRQTVASAAAIDPDQVEINLTFEPPWSPEALTEELRLEMGL